MIDNRVTTRVDSRHYKFVNQAFLKIMYDNGMINRQELEPKYFDVPEPFIRLLKDADKQLAKLSEEEMELICTGEEMDMAVLVAKKDLQQADELLDGFAGGWIIDGED
jgi:hypothetical protein